MLEYLYLVCLLCLTISVPILIRGCFNIHKELPSQGQGIGERIDKVADLLDEMAEMAADFGRQTESITSVSQTPTNPLMAILTGLMSGTPSPPEHGSKTQQTEREIYEVIEPQTTQTEDELNQHSS